MAYSIVRRAWPVLLLLGGLLCLGTRMRPVTAAPAEPARDTETNPYWLRAKEEVAASLLPRLQRETARLDRAVPAHVLKRGDTATKEITLTFDDGPHPEYTPRLLEILKACKVKATFFVVGEMAVRYPQLVKAEAAAGHCVANHTYHHVNLTKVSPAVAATELKAAGNVIEAILGHAPTYCRPPGGQLDKSTLRISTALDYTTVMWTDNPGDYAEPGAAVIQARLLKYASNGGIILLHDGIPQTMDVLPQVIATLRQRGYTFVTLDELRAHQRQAAKRAVMAKRPTKPASPPAKP